MLPTELAMASFYVHQTSPEKSTRLVAGETWAVAVRAIVGRHDPGAAMATRLVESFVDRMRSSVAALDGALDQQRARIASDVRASVEAAGAVDDDGVVFTLFVRTTNAVRVFNIGPQRTFLASCGEPVTVLAPQSLAQELRRAGTPAPQYALFTTRLANRHTTPADIDATDVDLPADAWLITQLDDRAPLLTLTAFPRDPAELVDALRHAARDVPNAAGDWLLASRHLAARGAW